MYFRTRTTSTRHSVHPVTTEQPYLNHLEDCRKHTPTTVILPEPDDAHLRWKAIKTCFRVPFVIYGILFLYFVILSKCQSKPATPRRRRGPPPSPGSVSWPFDRSTKLYVIVSGRKRFWSNSKTVRCVNGELIGIYGLPNVPIPLHTSCGVVER